MKKSIGAKPMVYPTPVFVVGTYDKAGRPNVMTAAWAGICCSRPPCVSVSLRNATYTYSNIIEHRAFTISIPSQDHIKEVDYFGMVSGKNKDKFSATGLTPVKSELVNAPYVEEFSFVLECKLLHTFEIGLHTQFIGEILDIKAEEAVLGENGLPAIEKVKPFLYAPEYRAYYGVGEFLGKAYSIGKELNTEPER
ncbi:MAG: flavin reductase family protein [Deltaproteobacteria bacterium]|nr:MAG: flavin reductase family protein [Deltaproteobacteria bacterium]